MVGAYIVTVYLYVGIRDTQSVKLSFYIIWYLYVYKIFKSAISFGLIWYINCALVGMSVYNNRENKISYSSFANI